MPPFTVDKINPSVKRPNKRFSFFCCCSTNEEEAVQEKPVVNPVPDTVRFLGFTDQNNHSLTAFFVVQAVKIGAAYKTPILFVSPQAAVLLKSHELVGHDLTDLIPDTNFSKSHSQLIGNFFEQFQKTGKNPSSFIGKGIIHGLRDFTVKLPNGELSQLNFRLDHTISRDPKTKKPIFYVIAHLPTQLELEIEKQQINANTSSSSKQEELINIPGSVMQ